MPEHGPDTPTGLRDLESFLWHDFEQENDWRDWLIRRGWPLAPSSYLPALAAQRVLRGLEGSNNGLDSLPDADKQFNGLLRMHELSPTYTFETGLALLATDATDPVARLLQQAVVAMLNGVWPRFKICRDALCRASFYDATRNGSRTWCSMDTCGSRNKMRRFRTRTGAKP